MHTALVITPSAVRTFHPLMKRDDPETRSFAMTSNMAMDIGGISMVISAKATRGAIEAAIEALLLQLEAR